LTDAQVLPSNVWHDPSEKKTDTNVCFDAIAKVMGRRRMGDLLGELWRMGNGTGAKGWCEITISLDVQTAMSTLW
jgi:hypothetical protein